MKKFMWPDIILTFLLESLYLVMLFEDYSEFSQEWGEAALDVVFTTTVVLVGMCLIIYYDRGTDKDDSSRRLKRIIMFALIIAFVPYVLPRWRLFELLDTIGTYSLLAGAALGCVTQDLEALVKQQEENSE